MSTNDEQLDWVALKAAVNSHKLAPSMKKGKGTQEFRELLSASPPEGVFLSLSGAFNEVAFRKPILLRVFQFKIEEGDSREVIAAIKILGEGWRNISFEESANGWLFNAVGHVCLGIRLKKLNRNRPLSLRSMSLFGHEVKDLDSLVKSCRTVQAAVGKSEKLQAQAEVKLSETEQENQTKLQKFQDDLLEVNGQITSAKDDAQTLEQSNSKATNELAAKHKDIEDSQAGLDRLGAEVISLKEERKGLSWENDSLAREIGDREATIQAMQKEKAQVEVALQTALEDKHLVKDDIEGLVGAARQQRLYYLVGGALSFAFSIVIVWQLFENADRLALDAQELESKEFLVLFGSRLPISSAFIFGIGVSLALARFFLNAIINLDRQVRGVIVLSLIARNASLGATDSVLEEPDENEDSEVPAESGVVSSECNASESRWRRALEARMAFLREYLPQVLDPASANRKDKGQEESKSKRLFDGKSKSSGYTID